jgi:hypothetical protein
MARQFLGRSLGQWLEYLAAILVGNGIYFLSLLPHLPVVLRHRLGQIDLGLALDFVVCAALPDSSCKATRVHEWRGALPGHYCCQPPPNAL